MRARHIFHRLQEPHLLFEVEPVPGLPFRRRRAGHQHRVHVGACAGEQRVLVRLPHRADACVNAAALLRDLGVRRAPQALLVLGLAAADVGEMRVRIDESGHHDTAGGIDDAHVRAQADAPHDFVRRAGGENLPAGAGDRAIGNDIERLQPAAGARRALAVVEGEQLAGVHDHAIGDRLLRPTEQPH